MKKKIIVLIMITILVLTMIFFMQKENKTNEEKTSEIYKITLDVNGRASVLETDKKGMLKEPEKPYGSGEDFLGWYIGDEKVDFSKPFTQNTTIRAKWEK